LLFEEKSIVVSCIFLATHIQRIASGNSIPTKGERQLIKTIAANIIATSVTCAYLKLVFVVYILA
jgi:hypothetical protein